jgi:hypothetical protein
MQIAREVDCLHRCGCQPRGTNRGVLLVQHAHNLIQLRDVVHRLPLTYPAGQSGGFPGAESIPHGLCALRTDRDTTLMHSQGEQSPEASPEDSGDQSGEGRWLTYDEIGQIRGIGRESAVKLAQRKRWRREPGNDGTARVFVPGNWQGKARQPRKVPTGDHSPGHSPELLRITSAFAAAVASLTDRATAAESGRDSARARGDALQAQLDQARRDAAEAARAADALRQADAARRARGLLARLRAAWRGE